MRVRRMLTILYEDNHCLAVAKPAGLLTQGDATGDPSLVDLVAADLKHRHGKPGNIFVGIVHRLDRPVSGVVLIAKTSKAAARLSEQFRRSAVEKVYLALVEGRIPVDSGVWRDTLRKDSVTNVTEVVDGAVDGGKFADTVFRVLKRGQVQTLIELRPRTGRSHQLRVQTSARGWPIVGDRKYGATALLNAGDGGRRIALHAASLTIKHPTRDQWLVLHAPVPSDWPVRFDAESQRGRQSPAEP